MRTIVQDPHQFKQVIACVFGEFEWADAVLDCDGRVHENTNDRIMQLLQDIGLYLVALVPDPDGFKSLSFSLWYRLPMTARACCRPPWCQHKPSGEIRHVDEIHGLCKYVDRNPSASLQECLRRVVSAQPHIVWLGERRFAQCQGDERWGLSLRAALPDPITPEEVRALLLEEG